MRGRKTTEPIRETTWNFFWGGMLLLPLAAAYWFARHPAPATSKGISLACVSGALTSGLGYAIWYRVLPKLEKTQAGIVQLCVPIVASIGAIVFLGERASARLLVASVLVLGGIALAIFKPRLRR